MKQKQMGEGRKFLQTHGSLLLVLAALFIVLGITCPNFAKVDNYTIIIRQTSMNLLIALGMTLVIIAGCIDLSVSGIYAATGIFVGILLTKAGWSIPVVLIAVICFGGIFGLVNGLLAAYTVIPPFIITLGMSYIASGAAYLIGGGSSVSVILPAFNAIAIGSIGFLPVPVLYTAAVAVILAVLMKRTRLGRSIYAVGSNVTAAHFAGIRIARVKIFVYVICGMLASLSSLVGVAKVMIAAPDAGAGYEIDAIAAVVIGGTSFEGGKGNVFGTILGCLLVTVISNGMNQLGINSYWQKVVKGIIILFAVFIDGYMAARNERKMLAAAK